MKRRAFALVAALVLSACELGTYSEEEFGKMYPLARVPALRVENLREALAEFHEHAKAPMQMTHLGLTPHGVTAQVAVSADGDFDTFVLYDGRFTHTPLHVSSRDRAEERTFSEDEVPFESIGGMAQQAVKRLGIPGGYVSSVSVSVSGHVLTISVDVTSERRNGTVRFDRAGTVIGQDDP